MEKYNYKEVEKKWQDSWIEKESFKAIDFSEKPKYYVLSEFFGPSGKGIHLGHVKCYTPTDIVARYKRLKGYNVLYPCGWDAFGLPTENYSLKMGISPKVATANNVKIFTEQCVKMGWSFDWSREINTTDENYYKWTQWIFKKLFDNDCAYKSTTEVNYCPHCQTVLSNEDSQGGICDRCKSEVEKRIRDVWFLKMRDYSDKMLENIERIEMAENHKESQRQWIGKSEGAEVDFTIKDTDKLLRIFTTRPDTLFGVTFMVIAPEHPIISELSNKIKNIDQIEEYKAQAVAKSDIDRSSEKDKTGIRIDGIVAINPLNQTEIPIFVADYVMMGYGTGAIMAVPAHDTRDYDFAKTHGLPIIEVIEGGDISKEAFVGNGKLVNSGFLNGMDVNQSKKAMADYLEKNNLGSRKINYKMQDWSFNRQRYWGEPFPIVNCPDCGYVSLNVEDLPLVLPETSDFTPDENGNGALSKVKDFMNTKCPKCGKDAIREADTMPNWAGSSWYWLRFLDPHNDKEFVSQDILKYWGAVDLYTGGTEHVTRHMLYANFWHLFLYDIGEIPFKDPFTRRMCNGLILDETGKKMGKSSGNGVDPREIVDEYGADVFRLHIMFIGEYEKNTRWTFDGIIGCQRFVNNVWYLADIMTNEQKVSKQHEVLVNALIKKADEGIENFTFNTVIAKMMEFINEVKKDKYITKEEMRIFLILLNPFAPHITSEMFERIFGTDITGQKFPNYDESKCTLDVIEVPVQLKGKLKGTVVLSKNASEDEAIEKAMEILNLTEKPSKVVYKAGKIINVIC